MLVNSNAVSGQPPLTPVSETGTDTTETASTSNATTSSANSSTSERSYFNVRPLNFSRPRPTEFSPGNKVQHDRSDSCSTPNAQSRNAQFGAPKDDQRPALPSMPFIFTDDVGKASLVDDAEKEVVSNVDFPWDDHLKDMRPAKGYFGHDGQRKQPRSLYQPGSPARSNTFEQSGSIPYSGLQRSKSASAPEVVTQHTRSAPRGTARSTHTHRSTPSVEDIPEEDWDGEDARSHHTVSENGDVAELASSSWSSSSYDVSRVLDEKEIKKLRKKGINPALYAEMKAARKGRGKFGVNILSGNAYLS